MSWVSFFADVSSEMVYPLLPLFLVGVLGASGVQLGLIEGAAVLIVALMSAYAGIRSDRRRRRVPWIRWGYGLPILGKTIIAVAHAWPLVLGGRLLDRFGKGLRGAPRDALITDAAPVEQRGQAFGLHRAFDTAGALLGVLVSAGLLWWLTGTPRHELSGATAQTAAQTPAWVYRAIFAVGAVMGLLSLILTFLVRDTERQEHGVTTDESSKSATPSGSLQAEAVVAASRAQDRVKLPREYWIVFALLVLFSLANSSDTFLLLRASDLGHAPWTVVLMYALYNLTYAAGSYPAGRFSDRLGRWRVIAVGWLIYAAVYAGFALMPRGSAWGLWPLMAIYGIYMALTDGVGKALIADHAPAERRGMAMGLFYAATGITTLLASLLTGALWDRLGPPAAFLASAGIAILAFLGLLLARIGGRATASVQSR